MSRSNFSTGHHPDDPPPSYEDIVCPSNTTEDASNSLEELAKATHMRFINGGRVPTDKTAQGLTPTTPPCEAIGGGVSQYVRAENSNFLAGTILEVPISDSEYAMEREYGRVPSPSPSTHRSPRISPNVNNTFYCDDLEEVDRSKLSNAEYRALLARRQRTIEAEVRRLDQAEQNAQPAQISNQTNDYNPPYLKPLIIVAFIISGMIFMVCLLIRFTK
ncbi:hypothetical protein TSAR_001967 [Trichomalopsis sarcophagae]|uniref:Uncharacterized protein n=1 Tax=Trichomalopsis sarcophagae TaxID=543379 RepID=A0A232EHN4_9HYME|nr:hypothetical protein TSAR_001967 [Trichomalopsis sarcophagae]